MPQRERHQSCCSAGSTIVVVFASVLCVFQYGCVRSSHVRMCWLPLPTHLVLTFLITQSVTFLLSHSLSLFACILGPCQPVGSNTWQRQTSLLLSFPHNEIVISGCFDSHNAYIHTYVHKHVYILSPTINNWCICRSSCAIFAYVPMGKF